MKKCCIKPYFNLNSINLLNSAYTFTDKILLNFHYDPFLQILIQIITPELVFHLLIYFHGKSEPIILRFICCAELYSLIYSST